MMTVGQQTMEWDEEEDSDKRIERAAAYARRELQSIQSVKLRTAFATNKERWIFEQVAEMSRTLGIPAPEIGFAYSKQQAVEMAAVQKYTGWYAVTTLRGQYYKIIIMLMRYPRYHKPLTYIHLKNTVAHELIHIAFPKMNHGVSFEKHYIKSLLDGHMLFDGRGITDTRKFKPKPTIDAEIAVLANRRKKWESKRKRAETAIKKLNGKIARLEKKRK